jgi:hypothetical protein
MKFYFVPILFISSLFLSMNSSAFTSFNLKSFTNSPECVLWRSSEQHRQAPVLSYGYSVFQDYKGSCRRVLDGIIWPSLIDESKRMIKSTESVRTLNGSDGRFGTQYSVISIPIAALLAFKIMRDPNYRNVYNSWKRCVLCQGFNQLVGQSIGPESIVYKDVNGGIIPRQTDYFQKEHQAFNRRFNENALTDFPDYLIRDVDRILYEKNLPRDFA